jgi:hypothetical protein
MTIFGKTLSQYVDFQKPVLVVIAVVGLLRLTFSLLGAPNYVTSGLSMTVFGLAALIYYGIAVDRRGFGGYKQLLPLVFVQNVVAHTIAIVGIVISAVTGRANVFTAPEYGGTQGPGGHILGHVIAGMLVFSLIGWGVASLVMLIARKTSGRPLPA